MQKAMEEATIKGEATLESLRMQASRLPVFFISARAASLGLCLWGKEGRARGRPNGENQFQETMARML